MSMSVLYAPTSNSTSNSNKDHTMMRIILFEKRGDSFSASLDDQLLAETVPEDMVYEVTGAHDRRESIVLPFATSVEIDWTFTELLMRDGWIQLNLSKNRVQRRRAMIENKVIKKELILEDIPQNTKAMLWSMVQGGEGEVSEKEAQSILDDFKNSYSNYDTIISAIEEEFCQQKVPSKSTDESAGRVGGGGATREQGIRSGHDVSDENNNYNAAENHESASVSFAIAD